MYAKKREPNNFGIKIYNGIENKMDIKPIKLCNFVNPFAIEIVYGKTCKAKKTEPKINICKY